MLNILISLLFVSLTFYVLYSEKKVVASKALKIRGFNIKEL